MRGLELNRGNYIASLETISISLSIKLFLPLKQQKKQQFPLALF